MKAIVDKTLKKYVKNKKISSITKDINLLNYIQPASIDIPIGNEIYLVDEKFIPFSTNVKNILKKKIIKKFSLNEKNSVILYKNQTYLIPVMKIKLNKDEQIKLSPKSSIGRIDLMVRAIFDKNGLYDIIFPNSKGTLYLEVTPHSFNVEIKKGIPLAQLRVFKEKNKETNNKKYDSKEFLFNNKKPIEKETLEKNKFVISLSLENNICGYVAKDTNKIINLSKIKYYNWRDFFEELRPKDNSIKLESNKFYILYSKEDIRVPPKYSIEMLPFSHLIGELRAHYAGFFDPGFGENYGASGVLEVRTHENITIFDNQPICLIEVYENEEIPEKVYGKSGNNYQNQKGPKLAKYFK